MTAPVRTWGFTAEVADYFDLRLSPDGQKLASNASYPAGSFNSEVWVHELVRAVRMRLTIDPDTDHSSPVWSPDGAGLYSARWMARPAGASTRSLPMVEALKSCCCRLISRMRKFGLQAGLAMADLSFIRVGR